MARRGLPHKVSNCKDNPKLTTTLTANLDQIIWTKFSLILRSVIVCEDSDQLMNLVATQEGVDVRDETEEGTNAIDIDSLPHLPEVTAPAAPQPQQPQFQRPPPPAGPQSQFPQNAGQFQGQQVVHSIAKRSDRAAINAHLFLLLKLHVVLRLAAPSVPAAACGRAAPSPPQPAQRTFCKPLRKLPPSLLLGAATSTETAFMCI